VPITPAALSELSRIVDSLLMPDFAYRYELRRGDEVIATGHMTGERALEVGGRIEIGGQLGMVRSIEPLLNELELRVVVQLLREGADS
jgi:hypothetical protein